MADITVSTFSEFRTAAAAAAGTYDNIICPENAVWDMNEIDPLNNISFLAINANVTGNGTSILHFKGYINIYQNKVVTRLNFLDCFSDQHDTYTAFICCNRQNAHEIWAKLKQCKVSCQLGYSTSTAMYNIQREQCSINLSFQHPAAIQVFGAYNQNRASRYNRVKITAPNTTGITGGYWIEQFSEFIIDMPEGDTINNTLTSCTIRGNLENVTKVPYITSAPISVMAGAPDFVYTSSNRIKPVTDAQMRDIAYLESIGFAIGSE